LRRGDKKPEAVQADWMVERGIIFKSTHGSNITAKRIVKEPVNRGRYFEKTTSEYKKRPINPFFNSRLMDM
jgi:hypothetical protein